MLHISWIPLNSHIYHYFILFLPVEPPLEKKPAAWPPLFLYRNVEADFTKILEKIDGLVALLKQEAEDDKSKKECLGATTINGAESIRVCLKIGYTLWWTNIAMENHHF